MTQFFYNYNRPGFIEKLTRTPQESLDLASHMGNFLQMHWSGIKEKSLSGLLNTKVFCGLMTMAREQNYEWYA